MNDLCWSFAPWAVFLVVARVGSFWPALVTGGVAAIVVLGRAIARHRVHVLDGVSVAYFAALGAGVALWHVDDLDVLARYAQAGAHGVITVVICLSVLFGRPFTESYARETVPDQYWHSSEFHSINRRISLAWALAFSVGTISLVVAGAVDVRQVLLRVVVPFGALVWAFKYTQQQIGRTGDPSTTGVSSDLARPSDPVR